jgi:uncharacterized membrane protein
MAGDLDEARASEGCEICAYSGWQARGMTEPQWSARVDPGESFRCRDYDWPHVDLARATRNARRPLGSVS